MNHARISTLAVVLPLLVLSIVAAAATADGSQANGADRGNHRNIPKVGLVIAMNEELLPYLSILGLKEVSSPFAWARRQPVKLYEGEYNGVFYRAAWNGMCPYCDPVYAVDQIQDQGAIPSVLIMLADGFSPDIIVSAGTTGGWSEAFNVNDIGICANGRRIIYSDRNVTDGNYGDYLYGWGNFSCATIPETILDKNNLRLANIATHHSFVAPPDEAVRLTEWSIDMVEEEGAAVAQQALINGIPFVKIGGVVNSYAHTNQNCATDVFFSCWNATCWSTARSTIGMTQDLYAPVHH